MKPFQYSEIPKVMSMTIGIHNYSIKLQVTSRHQHMHIPVMVIKSIILISWTARLTMKIVLPSMLIAAMWVSNRHNARSTNKVLGKIAIKRILVSRQLHLMHPDSSWHLLITFLGIWMKNKIRSLSSTTSRMSNLYFQAKEINSLINRTCSNNSCKMKIIHWERKSRT